MPQSAEGLLCNNGGSLPFLASVTRKERNYSEFVFLLELYFVMPISSKLALFDLDGTLVEFHHEYLFSEAERIIQKLLHPEVPRAELEEGFSAFDFFRFVNDRSQEEFTKDFWEHFDWCNFPYSHVLPGVHELLEKMQSKGIQIGIVTARLNTQEEVMEELQPSGLLDYVSHIVSREEKETDWTDKRAMLKKACAHFQMAPEDALLVGDIPSDIICGRDVGISTNIAVLTGGIRKDVLAASKPDHILQDVTELKEMFSFS